MSFWTGHRTKWCDSNFKKLYFLGRLVECCSTKFLSSLLTSFFLSLSRYVRNFKLFCPPQGTFNDWWWSRSRCIVKKDQIPFPTNNFSLFDFKLAKVEWRKDKLCAFTSNEQSSLLVWHGICFLHYCFFKVKLQQTNKTNIIFWWRSWNLWLIFRFGKNLTLRLYTHQPTNFN